MDLQSIFSNLIAKYSDDIEYNNLCWSEICNSYTSKGRYYHDLSHLENMLEEIEKVKDMVNDLDALYFSIFYHDIVYKPLKNNNEHKSALIFNKNISKTRFKNIAACMQQIEATKKHEFATEKDTNILLDLDLLVLGQSAASYDAYAINVRKEYQMVPTFMYNSGRKKVLEHFLNMNSIYKTAYFQNKYELNAKENLERELRSFT